MIGVRVVQVRNKKVSNIIRAGVVAKVVCRGGNLEGVFDYLGRACPLRELIEVIGDHHFPLCCYLFV